MALRIHLPCASDRRAHADRMISRMLRAVLALCTLLLASPGSLANAQPLLVLGDKDLAPYEFLEQGVPRGANIDLARAIGRRLGRPVTIELMNWQEAQQRALSGGADVLTMLGRTPEREQQFAFSDETMPVRFALFVRADEIRNPPAAAESQRIAVTRAGIARRLLPAAYPRAVLVDVDSVQEGLALVRRRGVDAFAGQEWAVHYQLWQLGATGIASLPPFHTIHGTMAVPLPKAQLLGEINGALRAIKADGEFDRILDNWSSTRMRVVPEAAVSTAALVAIVGFAILALLATLLVQSRRARKALRAEVAERRAAEDALARTNRFKDQFLVTLSHELRNPLSPVRTALAVMERTSDPDRLAQMRTMIGRQVDQLERLVNDLHDSSLVSTGRMMLQRAQVRLDDVVAQAVETLRPQLEKKAQTLDVALPAQPVTVDGDAGRLVQLVSNLLANASRYTPEGGRIRIALETDAAQARIEVRDSGIGIEPASLAHLFEMFYRTDEAARHAHGGLGLGLWLCDRIVRLHGGTLAAHSEGPGQGSCFTVTLPVSAAGAGKDETPAASMT